MRGLDIVLLIILVVEMLVGQKDRTVNTLQMLMENVENHERMDGKQFIYKMLESEKNVKDHSGGDNNDIGNGKGRHH